MPPPKDAAVVKLGLAKAVLDQVPMALPMRFGLNELCATNLEVVSLFEARGSAALSWNDMW